MVNGRKQLPFTIDHLPAKPLEKDNEETSDTRNHFRGGVRGRRRADARRARWRRRGYGVERYGGAGHAHTKRYGADRFARDVTEHGRAFARREDNGRRSEPEGARRRARRR